MLIEFRLRNHRSFLGEQVFKYPSISARSRPVTEAAPRKKSQTPRVAVIFGPNGSGKTNLILGLSAMRNMVLKSAGYTDEQYADLYTPFHFGDGPNLATEFETEIQLADGRYRYSVAFDGERVLFERLLVYRTGKPQRWFEREFDRAAGEEKWAPFSPNFNGSRELWRRMTRPKALFVSTAARLDCDQLQPLFRWFSQGIDIRLNTHDTELKGIVTSARDPVLKERMLEVLRAVDIPIRDIRIAEGVTLPDDSSAASAGRGGAQSGERPRVEFLYEIEGEQSRWVDSEREAHGTLRLLNFLGPLFGAMDEGKLLAVDEFDVGVHPLVARFLIQLAKHTPTASHPQFLLTSHNAPLMVPEVLDHEEIWLMERDRSRSSHLLSVSDRGPRKRERLVRGYLRGRYGAIPDIHAERFF